MRRRWRRWRIGRLERRIAREVEYINTFEWHNPPSRMRHEHRLRTLRTKLDFLRAGEGEVEHG